MQQIGGRQLIQVRSRWGPRCPQAIYLHVVLCWQRVPCSLNMSPLGFGFGTPDFEAVNMAAWVVCKSATQVRALSTLPSTASEESRSRHGERIPGCGEQQGIFRRTELDNVLTALASEVGLRDPERTQVK